MNYVKLIGIVCFAVGLLSSYFGAYYIGKQSCQVKEQKAVIKEQSRQDAVSQKLQTQQVKREVIYRDRIQVVEKANEDCLSASPGRTIIRVYNQVRAGEKRSLSDLSLSASSLK